MRIIYPSELRTKRREIELTQQQLAKRANVSQSLVAKIERGLVDPNFSSMLKLSQALDKKRIMAKDVMCQKIFWSTGDAKKDLALMKKKGISQLVRSASSIVSEKSMLKSEEYESVISVPDRTPLTIVRALVENGPVLVRKGEQVVGIIAIVDLL